MKIHSGFEKIEDFVYGLESLYFGDLDEIKRGLQPAKGRFYCKVHYQVTQ